MTRLEKAKLLVDVVALGGGGRAEHDQRGRGIERGKRLFIQRVTGREVLVVAKDRAQRLWDPTRRRLAADKVLVNGESLELGMEPTWPTHYRCGYRREMRGI
jgi:hypothetical protein